MLPELRRNDDCEDRGEGTEEAMLDRRPFLIFCMSMVFSAALVATLLLPARSLAQPGLCPQGYQFTGEYRDERVGDEIVSHPQCVRSPAWTPGRWRPGVSVANVLGACYTVWTCGSVGTKIYAPGSRRFAVPAQRVSGYCSVSPANPKKCGVCSGADNAPAAACATCMAPPECNAPNLGWRTRQALGCCD
jgi:hypothetical protein